ncbi:ketoacyl-ACP synthase III family protein [Sphaerisporangium sp. NPDC088356]|uniref:ketoacyl-ACP synthase III family protein n=1 Tax=Sphaerisporangium sp. NPDC088356 TaxID=3154871 RepID=UPI00341D30A6
MLITDIYIDSVGVRLGEPVDLADVVADGRYAATEYTANGLTGAVVSDEFPPDLAIAAARQALDRGATSPSDVRLLLHATAYYQGQDMWTPSAYIQQHTIGGRAPSMEVDQKSNGGMAALALAVTYLSACDGDDDGVMVTTGERFCLPGWDRFKSEGGTVMADGGTAILLTRRPSFARIVSVVLTSDSTLEGMYRGRTLRDAPASSEKPLNMRSRKTDFMRRRMNDLDDISRRVAGGVGECMREALAEAKTEASDVRRFVMPNIGQTVYWWTLLKEMGVGLDRTTWEYGRTISHLGAGDQAAGLDHLLLHDELEPGDRVVLAGAGYGFNWGCAVLEIIAKPGWSAS